MYLYLHIHVFSLAYSIVYSAMFRLVCSGYLFQSHPSLEIGLELSYISPEKSHCTFCCCTVQSDSVPIYGLE